MSDRVRLSVRYTAGPDGTAFPHVRLNDQPLVGVTKLRLDLDAETAQPVVTLQCLPGYLGLELNAPAEVVREPVESPASPG